MRTSARLHIYIMLRRKKANAVADSHATTIDDEEENLARGAALVRAARERLQQIADLPDSTSTGDAVSFIFGKMGGPEPVSMMLSLCELRLDRDGRLLEVCSLQRLQEHAHVYLEGLQNLALNMTVIYSLLLTIFVTLTVIHAGTPVYAATLDDDGASAGAAIFGDQHDAWAELAQWCWPADMESKAALRRGFYVGECVVNSLGALVCFAGLWEANFLYVAFGTGLPDAMTKLEYLFEKNDRMLNLWKFFDVALLTTPVSLVFITARVSFIAFLCSCVVFVVDLAYFLRVMFKGGCCGDIYMKQLQEARRRLQAIKRRRPVEVHADSGRARGA